MPVELWLPAAALAVEACIGYPQALYARISHPVVWIGKLIETLERRWNDPARSDVVRRMLGIVATIIVAGSAGAVGYAIQASARGVAVRLIVVVLIATAGLAQRSLYVHVRDVLRPLMRDDLPAARAAVVEDRRPRHRAAHAVRRLRRGDRKPRRELQRRHRRARVLARGRRPAGIVRVQGAQHCRQSHRSSRAALAHVRLGGGARGRRRQSASGTARGIVHRRRRRRRVCA